MVNNGAGPVSSRAALVLAGLAALGGAGCREPARHPGTYQGVIEFDERQLAFEVGGRLTELTARRGARVEPGVVLAALDDTLARTSTAGRQAEVAGRDRARQARSRAGSRSEDVRALEAQLRAAQANEELIVRNLTRDRALVEQGALTRAAVDEVEARARVATAEREALGQRLRELRSGARAEEVQGADAQVVAATAAAQLETERAARYQLRAPRAGTILDVPLEIGEVVSPGLPVVTLADTLHPYVDVFVPQAAIAGITVGAPAAVAVDSLPVTLPGVVEDVARRTEFTPRYVFNERERGSLVIRVRIRIDDPQERLHAGVPAFVTITRGPT